MAQYKPFVYPPNYALARIHHNATMPGTVNRYNQSYCPCCRLPQKESYKSWLDRSIDHDYKKYGGAVVTYFWLTKLYAFIFAMVLAVYSGYLLTVIYTYCNADACEKFLGFWVITNENLVKLLKQQGYNEINIRLFLLRGMAYCILMIGNTVALYVVGRFKRRYPDPKGISDFALIFKNVKLSHIQFEQSLKDKFPNIQIKQIFNISKMEPFTMLYNQKIKLYYSSLIEEDPKKKQKIDAKLGQITQKCQKYETQFDKPGDRFIVLVNSQLTRANVLKQYSLDTYKKMKYLIGIQIEETMYCQKCPIPQQIIWHNIGQFEEQKIKFKLLSFVYFVGLISFCYLTLFFCFGLIYGQYTLPSPWGSIVTFLLLFILVVMAVTFRQLMNRLSQMRHPNTQTNRTLFIVVTTVFFHYVFYLLVPIFHFWKAVDHEKNKILLIITNQTLTFITFQFVVTGIDLMHCCWNKRLNKIQDESKPIGCQKILHEEIQYPHFPIQFKLIAIFKIFSFIIFFAFQAPAILLLTFFLLVFLFFKDKHAIYFHYRPQKIDYRVQFKFLKIYSNFFSLCTFVMFTLTQHMETQFWIAFTIMILAIIVQSLFINGQQIQADQSDYVLDFDELKIDDSYQRRYKEFKQNVIDKETDDKIDNYLTNLCSDVSQTSEQSLSMKLN